MLAARLCISHADRAQILHISYETPNIVQEWKLTISTSFDFGKIKVNLYAKQDESVSYVQMPSWFVILIVFALEIIMIFYYKVDHWFIF